MEIIKYIELFLGAQCTLKGYDTIIVNFNHEDVEFTIDPTRSAIANAMRIVNELKQKLV